MAGRVAIVVVSVLAAGVARASEFTISYHEASGSGIANLFDGGPPVSHFGSLPGGTLGGYLFGAVDATRPGSLGAFANASGRSEIGLFEDRMGVGVSLDTSYRPSLFGEGDNPGGMAEGNVSSVIEFIMPADVLYWGYQLQIRDTIDFEGSTSVLFENVTQSRTLLGLASKVFPAVETTLFGNTGDLMRITTSMSGSGSTGPSSKRQYTSTLDMLFIVPEPATLLFLAFELIALARLNRQRRS